MLRLRDEITNTLRRLSGRSAGISQKVNPQDPDETRLATDPREGRQYGTYRVLRRLGAGGMGHVYLALDMRLNRHAALKFLSPKLKSNPEMLALLKQEARTASSLNHPNILTIYEIDESDGEPFIASEYVEGITLRQAIESGVAGPASALDIALQIAAALKPAHEAGIIHRDLKPGNVMLRPDGLVKVIDFGLAKFTPQGHIAPSYEPLSDPGSIAGTVQYMSPEQARGDVVDQRTDLWSLGVILYEMVAQRKPFDGETESHVVVAILDHRATEIKPALDFPAGLPKLIDKALAKTADRRFQSAGEMLEALKALDPISQSKGSHFRLARLAIKQRKRRRTWLAASVCAVAAAVAAWWWPLHGREQMLGPDWFVPAHYTQVTHTGDVTMASLSPDGGKLAYSTKKNGQSELHLLNLKTQEEFHWQPYPGDTQGITFAPDSSTIYFSVHDQAEWGRLYQASVTSSQPAVVMEDMDGPISFSPDGREFAFRRRYDDKRTNREAVVVAKTDDRGHQDTVLTKFSETVGRRIAWSTAGTMAVNLSNITLAGGTQPTVLLFNRDGRELSEHPLQKMRLMSGPSWMDSNSMLIFAGVGSGGDEDQAEIVELATRTGQLCFFPSPPLAPNGLTVARDFQDISAVTADRSSALWVASAAALDKPSKWLADGSFHSLAFTSDNAIIYSVARGGYVSLWKATAGDRTQALSQPANCASQQPAPVPGTKTLLFLSNCAAEATAWSLWTLDEQTGARNKVLDHVVWDGRPAIAQDGNTLLVNSWQGNFPTLQKVSLATGAKSQLTALFQTSNAAISPDGQHVACQIREHYDGKWRAAVLSVRDGHIEKDNLPLHVDLNSPLRWSPDGKALDYVDLQDPANIWRLNQNASQAVPLTHLHGNPISDFGWSQDGTRLAWISSVVGHDVIIFHRGGKNK